MKKAYAFIFVCTILDAACTAAGIRIDAITEINPIVSAWMTAAPELTAGTVCLVVGALLLWLHSLHGRIRWLIPVLIGMCAIKIAVLGAHLNWILQVI